MKKLFCIGFLLAAMLAHAAPVMVVRGTQYLDGWPIDADGWSTFTPTADTRIIYVSASEGDDANDGLSEEAPKATLAAGRALLRSGSPDWLLLKRGDEWPTEYFAAGTYSGLSKTSPLLIGAYGNGPRPLLLYVSLSGGQYVVVRDIHCINSIHNHASDTLIENVWTGGTNYLTTVANNGPRSDFFGSRVTVHRCIFDDHYFNGAGQRSGLWFGHPTSQTPSGEDYILSECIFDQDRRRALREDEALSGNQHHMYIGAQTNRVTLRNNVVVRGMLDGCGARGNNAVFEGNLTYDNSYANMTLGGYLEAQYWPDGLTYTVRDNVSAGTRMDTNTDTGSIVTLTAHLNPATTSYYQDNLHLNSVLNFAGKGLVVSGNTLYGKRMQIYDNLADNMQINNNTVRILPGLGTTVYLYRGFVADPDTDAVTYDGNHFYTEFTGRPITRHGWSEMTYEMWLAESFATNTVTTEPSFVDEGRNMQSYMEDVLGLGPYADDTAAWEAFIALAKAQDRATLNSAYSAETVNAYLRAGYEVTE